MYRFRKIVGESNFSEKFRKLINRYKRIGYSLDIMRQTASLVVNPVIVDGYTSLFNCTTAVRASGSMTASSSNFNQTICLVLCPPWFNYWFSFTLAYSRISHEYSSLFIIVINLIFMFPLWCIDWVEALMRTDLFMYFCIKCSIGTQGEVG